MNKILKNAGVILVLLSLLLFFLVLSVEAKGRNLKSPTNIQVEQTSNKNIKISWKKVKGATSYIIYRKDNSTTKYKKVKVVTGKKKSWVDKKVRGNTEYTYAIKTVKKQNRIKIKSKKSYWVSIYNETSDLMYSNLKKIRFTNPNIDLYSNSVAKINIDLQSNERNKRIYNSTVRWWTSDASIATIDRNGYLTARRAGKVYVYVKGHNGVTKKQKFVIKDWRTSKLPILTFHRITTDENKKDNYPNYEWVAALSDFEAQMKYLYDNHYKTISAEEFEKWYDKGIEYPRKTVMITFDDGDYEFYYLVLPILKRYNFKAVMFSIGAFTPTVTSPLSNEKHYLGEDVIDEIRHTYPNVEIEAHSFNLHYRVTAMQPAVLSKTYMEIDQDFKNNSKFGFHYIAYPFGVYTDDFVKAAKNNGMRMGFKFGNDTYATRKDDRFKISRVKINGQITYDKYVKKLRSYLK